MILLKYSSDRIIGTALNGVFLYAGVTHENYDAYYPKSWTGHSDPAGYSFDVCLGTFETEGTYRYHMFSPCILSETLKDVSALCLGSSYPGCAEDRGLHSISLLT